MKKTQITLLFLLLFTSLIGIAQGSINLKAKLSELFPDATITKINNLADYTESYRLVLKQPLDHEHPEKGTFNHYIYLSHRDYSKPMVIETHGYDSGNIKSEVSSLLNANQVAVEYRFYGNSRPNPIPWEYLTNDQAMADYHSIVTKLKTLYKEKWISTGISKGGAAALIYKSKYPTDIDIVVPYVAPITNDLEDARTNDRINSNGTPQIRLKIADFQRAVLQNRAAVMNEFVKYANASQITYTAVSMEEALEYAVLEFPFSFWQWGWNSSAIPANTASAATLFNYLNSVASVAFYGDVQYEQYLPSFYQHMMELGYYGFDFTPVSGLLTTVTSTSNSRFAPLNTPAHNPNYIRDVRNYLETKAEKIMYIHGGNDPWGACLVNPDSNLDFKIMTLPGGSHSTRINNFKTADKNLIVTTLNRWLTEPSLNTPDHSTNPDSLGVIIYPTTKEGIYAVEVENMKKTYTVEVFNLLGQIVLQKQVAEKATTTIDLRNKEKGIYVFKIKFADNSATIVQKVLKN